MADQKKSLFGSIGGPLAGAAMDPRTGLIGRTHERTQGCWNCSHYSFDRAREMWKHKRQQDLAVAAKLVLDSPMGENDPQVRNIRRMVDAIDIGLATYNLGACDGTGTDKDDNPVGDLVKSNYLCRLWNAAQGASVARGGQAPDPLPMELLEDDNKTS